MQPPVIDTLGLADHLKSAGLESDSARAVVRALGDELAERVATKHDLNETAAGIRAEMATKDDLSETAAGIRAEMATKDDLRETAAGIRAEMADEFKAVRTEMANEFRAVRTEMAGELKVVRTEVASELKVVRTEVASELKVVRTEVAGEFKAMDVRLQALDNKIGMQGRFVFLILAVIVGLGIFSATAPYMLLGEIRQALSARQISVEQPVTNVPGGAAQPAAPMARPDDMGKPGAQSPKRSNRTGSDALPDSAASSRS